MWIVTERKGHRIAPTYVVRLEGELRGISICETEWEAQQVADALNREAYPMQALKIEEVTMAVMGSWQKCSAQMPDDETLVLAYTAGDRMLMAWRDGKGWWDRDNILITGGVTHWCDPVPPAEGECIGGFGVDLASGMDSTGISYHEDTKSTKGVL